MGRLLPENLEFVRAEGHESFQHARQEMLDLHTLLDLDRDADRVDTRFDEAGLLITLADHDRLHEQRLVVLELDFWVHLAFDDLGWEVSQVEDRLQVQANVAQIILHRRDHLDGGFLFNNYYTFITILNYNLRC